MIYNTTLADRVLFDNLISHLSPTAQAQMRLEYARRQIDIQEDRRREHDQLVKEITAEVMKQIQINLNSGDFVQQIEALNKAINSLGQ